MKACSPGFTRPYHRCTTQTPPNRNALFVPRKPQQQPPQLVVEGQDSHAIIKTVVPRFPTPTRPRKETRPNLSFEGKLSPARSRFHVRHKPKARGDAPSCWTPPPRAMSTKLGRVNQAKLFRRCKTLPSTPRAPQKHLPKFAPLLHLVPQHCQTRDRDRPRLTRWSRGSFWLAC